ncbi:DUF2817 domain-containing protein [Pandoraea capi]|uniref:DUF2817 domain-containing protein n=1 Tax=Pandoraea capi TaxID=2508286 RepID=UPI001FEB6962|nr:DUF2817 domain-containing protein [Pandoraea capi]
MSTQPTWWQAFGVDYADARQRFRSAADRAGADLSTYVHPSAKAPDGSDLTVDVARLGTAHAPSMRSAPNMAPTPASTRPRAVSTRTPTASFTADAHASGRT